MLFHVLPSKTFIEDSLTLFFRICLNSSNYSSFTYQSTFFLSQPKNTNYQNETVIKPSKLVFYIITLLPLHRNLAYYTLAMKMTQETHSVILRRKLHLMKGNKQEEKQICHNTKLHLSLIANGKLPFVPYTVCIYHP